MPTFFSFLSDYQAKLISKTVFRDPAQQIVDNDVPKVEELLTTLMHAQKTNNDIAKFLFSYHLKHNLFAIFKSFDHNIPINKEALARLKKFKKAFARHRYHNLQVKLFFIAIIDSYVHYGQKNQSISPSPLQTALACLLTTDPEVFYQGLQDTGVHRLFFRLIDKLEEKFTTKLYNAEVFKVKDLFAKHTEELQKSNPISIPNSKNSEYLVRAVDFIQLMLFTIKNASLIRSEMQKIEDQHKPSAPRAKRRRI